MAGHAAAKTLRELQIPWVAGVAGESFLPLLDGLREEEIPFVQTAHEAGAVFAAIGHARASGDVGVVAVTRGPGAANALIGIHEAFQGDTPLVILVGQIESAYRGRGALQEMEFTQVFASAAKATFEVTQPDQLVSSILAATRKAQLGRPGPVIVSIPADHFYAKVERNHVQAVIPRPVATLGELTGASVSQIGDAMLNARKGLIIVGQSFRQHRYADLLANVSEASGFGVLGGHAFLDVMPAEHPLSLGTSTIRSSSWIARALEEADTVVVVDHRLGDRVTQTYSQITGEIIRIASYHDIGWDEYLTAQLFTSDPIVAMQQLYEALRSSRGNDRRLKNRVDWITGIKSNLSEEEESVLAESRSEVDRRNIVPFSALIQELDRLLPDQASVVSDAGSFNDWFTRYLRFPTGREYYGPLSGSMGFALPASIGVQLSHPRSRTVVLVGDGGFLMTGMELSTLSRLGASVTVCVFRNDVWGSIALHQDKVFPGNRFGVELKNPDYAQLSRSFGIPAWKVEAEASLGQALQAALDTSGPSLIEVSTDPHKTAPSCY